MSHTKIKMPPLCLFVLMRFATSPKAQPVQQAEASWSPQIPKTWDEQALVSLEVPLADPEWYRITGTAVAKDGTMPFYRYVIREKGKVEIGVLSCGSCHTRVMPDGSIIKGAQGNFPFDRAMAYDYRTGIKDVSMAHAAAVR